MGVNKKVDKVFNHLILIIDYDKRKIVSEYCQEIPQSQTADKLVAP